MKYLLLILVLSGCSSVNNNKLGHWLDTYPSEYSQWQCVEPFAPHKNIKC